MSVEQIVALIAGLLALGSQGVFYAMYREEIKKRDDQRIEENKRWQDTVQDARDERDKLLEIMLGMAKDSTKAKRTPEMARRIQEFEQQAQRPKRPLTPPIP